ncbi:MAG: type II CAAX endopeptidase family protein [Lutimonas sp.]
MKKTNSLLNIEIITFSVATIALSSLICFAAYDLDEPNLSILSVFTPSLVALVLTAVSNGKKGVYDLFVGQTVRKTAPKWLILSFFGLPALASLAVLTSLKFDVSAFALRSTQLMPQALVILLIAIGEEYGWRGFLLPRLLNKFSLFNSSLILGLIWGFWHFPAYLIGTGVPEQMDFLVFLLWVVLGTLFISWIYYYTRSVLTSILAHIGANAAFNYLPVLPEFTGNMKTFWIFLLYLTVLLLTVFYARRNEIFNRK